MENDEENDWESENEGDVAVEVDKPELEEPPKYANILHNDNYTTMDFVIEILVKFFGKSHQQASELTMEVHHKGKAVAGIYSFEIAETKAVQVQECAKQKGFPLKCTVELIEDTN